MTSSILDKILSDRVKYSCAVKTLGECKLPSPLRHSKYVADGARVFATEDATFAREAEKKLGHLPTFEKAGPKERIFHDPRWTRVGVVTAGGLCPGLNTVIKGLVEILKFDYGVSNVFGIRYGYAGLNPGLGHEPLMLDADAVDTIHEAGGTVLGSSRGQQPADVMVDTLVRMNINVLFCIGGDGSLRCASDIAAEVARRGLKISIVGIPKTIDNDLMFVGRSFGFESAVAQAAEVIRSAHVEAKGTPHGVGLVKVMGRDSGFIAAYASLANPVVNFCLVPEMDFEIDGDGGLLAALERRFASGKSHAVVVVAEGAGQRFFEGGD
ncbi:MAG: ATP-dependent 6-phosphofructokinase, partial [Kiritimatiellae bacterium]|nr:ATP-dependent 6-phosphofructokinase [Kiritimatiellia bacterium]